MWGRWFHNVGKTMNGPKLIWLTAKNNRRLRVVRKVVKL